MSLLLVDFRISDGAASTDGSERVNVHRKKRKVKIKIKGSGAVEGCCREMGGGGKAG